MSHEQSETLIRLPDVIARMGISRSLWWQGIKAGKYPNGIKLSSRVTVWRKSEIDALIRSLSN